MEKISSATRYLILIMFLFISNIYAQQIVRTPEQERDYNGYFLRSSTEARIDSVIKYENYSNNMEDSVKTGCWEFKYDSEDRLTSQTAWSWTGDSWYGTYKLSYTYNTYDKIEQKQAYEVWMESHGWRKGRKTVYTYNNDGMLIRSKMYNYEGLDAWGVDEIWLFDKGADYSYTTISGKYYLESKEGWVSLGVNYVNGVPIHTHGVRDVYKFDYTNTSYTLEESYKGINTRKYVFEHENNPRAPRSREKYKWDNDDSSWEEDPESRKEYSYGFGVNTSSLVDEDLMSYNTQTIDSFEYISYSSGYWHKTDFHRIPNSNKIIYSEYTTSVNGFENREFYRYVDNNDLSEKVIDNSAIIFYPNPTSNELKISNPLGEKMNIFIYDSKGILVHKASEKNKTILLSLNHIKPGVYFINCQTNEGLTKSKIIKQ